MRKRHSALFVLLVGLAIVVASVFSYNQGFREERYTDFAVFENIEYGEELHQEYDIAFALTGPAKPVVVAIHGGGFVSGDNTSMMRRYVEYFNERDIAVMSPNYRLAPKNIFPDPIEDVACAISHMVDRADEYNIDPKKIILLGNSAGSHLGAMVAYNQEEDWQANCADKAEFTVVGFIGLSGVYDFDLVPKGKDRFADKFSLGANYNIELLSEMAPIVYVSSDDPRTLLIHGDQDFFVNFENSIALDEKLKESGGSSMLHLIAGMGHGDPNNTFRSNLTLQDWVSSFLADIL